MRFLVTACRKGRLIYVLAFLAAFALTPLTASGGNDLSELLSGRSHPLSMKLREFDGEWRRVMVAGGSVANGNVEVNVSGSTQGSTSQNNILSIGDRGQAYVTKGLTVSVDGRTYLVAYRLPTTTLDLNSMLQALATKTLPEAQVLTPESSLRLSLLNVQGVGSIEDVRVFDMTWEIAQSQEAAQKLANLIKAMAAKPPQAGNPPKPEKK